MSAPAERLVASAPCPVCGGGLSEGRQPWVLSCGDCKFLCSTLAVEIGGEAHGRLDEAERLEALRPLRQQTADHILDGLQRVRPLQGRLLEVGCAHGWFLEAAGARGFETVGIEPDTAIADLAEKRGLRVLRGLFPDVLDDGERFDVVIFNDVLEHIPDPRAVVQAAGRALVPEGHLVVNAPSSEGLLFRTAAALDRLGVAGPYERLWQKGFPSPHVSYFHPDHVATLAGEAALDEVVRARLPSVRGRGLWSRLRYDRDASRAGSAIVFAAMMAALPALRLAPPDIRLQIFCKRRR